MNRQTKIGYYYIIHTYKYQIFKITHKEYFTFKKKLSLQIYAITLISQPEKKFPNPKAY